MTKEREATILNIDIKKFTKNLLKHGAVKKR